MATVRTLANFVAGAFVDTGENFADTSPVDGRLVANVARADAALVDRAVAAARAALAGDWGAASTADRVRWLRALADGVEARFDEFVAAEMADTGKDEAHVRAVDVARGAANFRTFADLVAADHDAAFRTPAPDGGEALGYVVRKPLGVVAAITPWNLPLLLLTWKLAPALARGNSVIAKPSEETPFTATLLAEVIRDAGLPAGAFNLVHGGGEIGAALSAHVGVNAVTFTGSTRTGRSIMRSAAVTMKTVSFELGGKNAALVFADCDFEAAVAGVARSSFANAGQVCLCTERVYVERPIYEAFVRALAERAEAIGVGRPGDPGVNMGPLISRAHQKKVMAYFDLARAEGADVVAGGVAPHFGDDRDRGAFVRPTVWAGLSDDARCMREEVFGPVCNVAPFDDEAEAVRRANDSEYGLAACIWTRDLSRAHRVAPRIEAGMVWVNTWFLRDLRTPFGGVKLSGVGREGGAWSLDFYSEPSTICVKI